MVENVEIVEHLGNSDHNIITWKMLCKVCIDKNNHPFRQYHKANYDGMRKWFSGVEWTKEFDGLDVDNAWNKFCSIVNSATSSFVPLGFKKSKNTPSG